MSQIHLAESLGSPTSRSYAPVNTSPDHGAQGVSGGIADPREYGMNSRLETTMLELRETMRPGKSKTTFDNKIAEYYQYCELVYPEDRFKCTLSSVKLYRFFFYLTFREQKKRG